MFSTAFHMFSVAFSTYSMIVHMVSRLFQHVLEGYPWLSTCFHSTSFTWSFKIFHGFSTGFSEFHIVFPMVFFPRGIFTFTTSPDFALAGCASSRQLWSGGTMGGSQRVERWCTYLYVYV